jgi:hypothetical protein
MHVDDRCRGAKWLSPDGNIRVATGRLQGRRMSTIGAGVRRLFLFNGCHLMVIFEAPLAGFRFSFWRRRRMSTIGAGVRNDCHLMVILEAPLAGFRLSFWRGKRMSTIGAGAMAVKSRRLLPQLGSATVVTRSGTFYHFDISPLVSKRIKKTSRCWQSGRKRRSAAFKTLTSTKSDVPRYDEIETNFRMSRVSFKFNVSM